MSTRARWRSTAESARGPRSGSPSRFGRPPTLAGRDPGDGCRPGPERGVDLVVLLVAVWDGLRGLTFENNRALTGATDGSLHPITGFPRLIPERPKLDRPRVLLKR